MLYAHYNKYERCKMKMKFKKNKHELEVAETPDQIMEDTAAEELETQDAREPEILDDVSASNDTEIHGRLGDFSNENTVIEGAPPMLKIDHLKKRYANSEVYSVKDLSLELKPGEVFGFLGKNGAGKSTTIKCLTGILPFEEGKITICGYDIVKEPMQAKMNMGYVPDNHSVYERLTGREYVNYVADLYRVPKADREERLNMFLDLFRLRFAVDRQIKSYSHGMKQKICIIAALIYEPKLWVLDEPMMGLDPQSTAEILSYMREHVRKGNTVFFSSHNLDMVAKVCNRVAIINDGILHCVIDLSDPANRETLEKRFFEISSTEEERRAWNV